MYINIIKQNRRLNERGDRTNVTRPLACSCTNMYVHSTSTTVVVAVALSSHKLSEWKLSETIEVRLSVVLLLCVMIDIDIE